MSNHRCLLVEYETFLGMFEIQGWDRTGKYKHLWNNIYNELCSEHDVLVSEEPQCTCGSCPDE